MVLVVLFIADASSVSSADILRLRENLINWVVLFRNTKMTSVQKHDCALGLELELALGLG